MPYSQHSSAAHVQANNEVRPLRSSSPQLLVLKCSLALLVTSRNSRQDGEAFEQMRASYAGVYDPARADDVSARDEGLQSMGAVPR